MFMHLRPEPHPMPPMVAAHRLGRVMRKALAKDPAHRYADARPALTELPPCDVPRLPRLPRPEPAACHQPTLGDAGLPPEEPGPGGGPGGRPVGEGAATERRSAPPVTPMPAHRPTVQQRVRDSASTSQNVMAGRRQLTSVACEVGPLAALSESLG